MKKLILFLTSVIVFILPGKAQYTVLYNFTDTLIGSEPFAGVVLVQNKLYGVTYRGGAHDSGCIYSIDTNGNGLKDLYDFYTVTGSSPFGALIVLGKRLYGMTSEGGANGDGCIFSIDTDGTAFHDVYDFNGSKGSNPWGSLTYVAGSFYGMAESGGANGYGCVFSVDSNGINYKDLHDFSAADGDPYGSLTYSAGMLYGMTYGGAVFSIDTGGSNYNPLPYYAGGYPYGDLTLVGNTLYGMTSTGGFSNTGNNGDIFRIAINGNGYADMFNFNETTGDIPFGSLTYLAGRLYGVTTYGANNQIFGPGSIFSMDTDGNGFNYMAFTQTNGAFAHCKLIYSGSTLFGTTPAGGSTGHGVIFKISAKTVAGLDNVKDESDEVKVYPNPSNGMFNLEIRKEELGTNNRVEIYNTLGEKVYSQFLIPNSQFLIDLSSQSNGVYFYRVLDENDSLVGNGKLIIQK